MAFENLTERLQNVFKNLRRKGKISESDIQEATKEIRLALLEADVALPVVKDFIKKIRERAIGHEVIDTLNPAQQIIKIGADSHSRFWYCRDYQVTKDSDCYHDGRFARGW